MIPGFGKIPWIQAWPPTPVFMPVEFHEKYEKQKDMILKDELPRSVGAQYATGVITPERTKRWHQSRNTTQFWMGLVMGVKSDVIKNSIAKEPGP